MYGFPVLSSNRGFCRPGSRGMCLPSFVGGNTPLGKILLLTRPAMSCILTTRRDGSLRFRFRDRRRGARPADDGEPVSATDVKVKGFFGPRPSAPELDVPKPCQLAMGFEDRRFFWRMLLRSE